MREKQIREEIWEIIRDEIDKSLKERDFSSKNITQRIIIRITTLLDNHEAILVYQP